MAPFTPHSTYIYISTDHISISTYLPICYLRICVAGGHEAVRDELPEMRVQCGRDDQDDRHRGQALLLYETTTTFHDIFQVSELDTINSELADGNLGVRDIASR